MKVPKIVICFLFFMLVSCGKEFTCECTNVSTLRMGNTIDTFTQTTVDVDKYKDQNEARLMCENLKVEITAPTGTSITTCKIK